MHRDRIIQLIALMSMFVCLGASIGLTTRIADSVGRNRLVYADAASDGDPPEVALGVAMGAFRGLFVNMLWMRANEQKEAGNYYEAVDLASTITKLQPRFPRVWAFHAWNLSYNIAVATNTREERWQWVQSGINLLRSQGIPNNPNDLLLHKELAWIYLHKVQGVMDDANAYYKRAHAREWQIVMGGMPKRTRELRSREAYLAVCLEKLERISGAPRTLDAVVAEAPQAGALIEMLRSLEIDPGNLDDAMDLLEYIEIQQSIARVTGSASGVRPANDVNDPILQHLVNPQMAPGWTSLVAHLRRRVLVERYHMEPERMIRYTRKYGPMDWRHGSSHAVYWSARGVEEAMFRATEKNQKDFDFLNTDRVTVQAVQDLYRSGSLQFDLLNPDFFIQLPSPDFIDTYRDILDELMERDDFGRKSKIGQGRIYDFYSAGYENFLRDVIRFMYRRGDMVSAEKYYKALREWPYLNENRTDLVERLRLTLPDFVVAEIREDDRFTSPEVARSEVVGSLEGAYINGLLENNTDLFTSNILYARQFHKVYIERQVFNTGINQNDSARLEIMDREFEVFAARVLAGLCNFAGVPDGAIMYQRVPDATVKRYTYEFLAQSGIRAQLDANVAGGAPGFEVWFPSPPGMENYLRELDARRAGEEAERKPSDGPRIESARPVAK